MNPQLEVAIAELNKLNPEDQDTFAAWILAELESEQHWQVSFTASANIFV